MKRYIVDSFEELVNKTSWPSWKNLQSNTVVVAVASVIFAMIIFLMDKVFGSVLESFFKLF